MSRKVIRIDLETKERVEYRSVAEAARESLCSRSTVRYHCNGWTEGPFYGRYRFNWGEREK